VEERQRKTEEKGKENRGKGREENMSDLKQDQLPGVIQQVPPYGPGILIAPYLVFAEDKNGSITRYSAELKFVDCELPTSTKQANRGVSSGWGDPGCRTSRQ